MTKLELIGVDGEVDFSDPTGSAKTLALAVGSVVATAAVIRAGMSITERLADNTGTNVPWDDF